MERPQKESCHVEQVPSTPTAGTGTTSRHLHPYQQPTARYPQRWRMMWRQGLLVMSCSDHTHGSSRGFARPNWDET